VESEPRVGDRLSVAWPMEDDSVQVLKATVTAVGVSKSKKRKRDEERQFKYTLRFDDGDVQKTRLKHLKWHKIASPSLSLTSSSMKSVPVHSRIVAPMVGGSELAFRLLCRRYYRCPQ
jgi:hypothetical protein